VHAKRQGGRFPRFNDDRGHPVDEVTQWLLEEAYSLLLELHEAGHMIEAEEKAVQDAAIKKSTDRRDSQRARLGGKQA
jgi:methylmalonyl-CoA mutase N-terminal domain/subunit